jgi:hypothetical protein
MEAHDGLRLDSASGGVLNQPVLGSEASDKRSVPDPSRPVCVCFDLRFKDELLLSMRFQSLVLTL